MIHKWNHDVIRTPIDTINIIGAGGIDSGTISEIAGPPGCLVGSTRIRLLDGTSPTLKEIADNPSKELFVYSYDQRENRVRPARAFFSGERLATNLVRVNILCGTTGLLPLRRNVERSVICTRDHLFLLSTNQYVQAGNLSYEDPLMAIFWKDRKGLDFVSWTSRYFEDNEQKRTRGYGSNPGFIPVHHLVAFDNIENSERTGLEEVHHKNNNRKNNYPDNLEVLTKEEHSRHHQTIRNLDPMFQQKVREARQEWLDRGGAKLIADQLSTRNTERWKEFKEGGRHYGKRSCKENDTVLSVEILDTTELVYDLHVPLYNNFCVDLDLKSESDLTEFRFSGGNLRPSNGGVFVHNSGKSSYAYGTASNFLKDNLDGVVVILDPELSVDLIRLEHTFELDMNRVIILNARTLEDGFQEIYRILKDQIEMMKQSLTTDAFLAIWKLEDAMKLLKEIKIEFNLSLLDENVENSLAVQTKARIDITTILAFRGKLRPRRPTPVLIIWDTIAASKPKAEVEAAMAGKDPMNAGGMGLRARVLEINLAITMSSLYERPVTIFLLNQIRTTGFGSYQGTTETSSGGNALKHTNHYYFWFAWGKKLYDEKTKMYIGSKSNVSVLKSKFGPTINNIPVYINDQLGGKIVSDNEAALIAVDIGFIYSSGPWWRIQNDPVSYRWEQPAKGQGIANNSDVRKRCIEAIVRHFRKNYFTLDIVYKKLGITVGSLTEEDVKERNTSFNKSAFKPVLFVQTEDLKQGEEKGNSQNE